MADVPMAREILKLVLSRAGLKQNDRADIQTALNLMTRASPVKRSKAKAVNITPKLRRQVTHLAAAGLSHHVIAEATGLRNGGRVSEILNGKR